MSVRHSINWALTHPFKPRVSTPGRKTDRKDLDSFIDTLVGDTPRGVNAGTSSPAGRKSHPIPVSGTANVGAETYDGTSIQSRPRAPYATTGTQTLSTVPVETTYEQSPALTSKPTIEILTYSKGVQTSDSWSPQRQRRASDGFSDSDADGSPSALRSPTKRRNRKEREREEELRQNIRREIEEELKAAKDLNLKIPNPTDPSNFPARGLTDEEVNAVTASEDFLEFVERSSKVIEKALDQDYDVLADYALDGAEVESDEDEGYGSSRGKRGKRVRQMAQFYDERWSRKRMISDMNFSPKVRLSNAENTQSDTTSSLSYSWHHTLRTHPRLKILQVLSRYGTCTFIPAQNIPFITHQTY